MNSQTSISDSFQGKSNSLRNNGYLANNTYQRELIKSINIKDVISQHVELKKKGSSWKGNCPFHDEKTASFDVNESKGTYKCFGCDEQGDVVEFIMKTQNKTFPEALQQLGINNLHNQPPKTNKAEYSITEATGEWHFEKKKFTKEELSFLGTKVTEGLCEKYNYYSLESYTTPKGHKFSSTPEYPMFILDFGTWQKIYQPMAQDKGFRFLYIHKENQPKDFIYGMEVAKNQHKQLQSKSESEESGAENDEAVKLKHIIKASGERDALNLASFGYHVIWLDSEAQMLSNKQYYEILSVADELCNLPDIDKAGINYANKLNLKFLDIRTIWLPRELARKKDSRGYQCKDFTDFVKINAQITETKKLTAEYKFKKILESSFSLSFVVWEIKNNKKTLVVKNTRLYNFLAANGYFKHYPIPWDKSTEEIVRVINNIAEKIETPRIVESFIFDYLNDNHYDENRKDAVFRSKQISEASLYRGLETIEIDDKYYSQNHQDVFFSNTHWRITRNGTEERNLNQYEKHIWKDRIINKNVSREEPLFTIEYSEEYKTLHSQHAAEKQPDARKELKQQLEEFPETDKYVLEISEHTFSLLQFLTNTSNFHWKKEQEGQELTEAEKKENILHLINKLWVLGYLMAQAKEKSKPYAPILMDGDNSEIGEHRGGTGKSFMSKLPYIIKTNDFEKAIKNNTIDAQQKTISDDKYKMANIDLDLGYIIYNDCSLGFNFHQHLNEMEGSITIRRMHQNPISIPFEKAPKISFTLNHGIKNDGSLSRRAVPVIFSDYYHAADDTHKKEFNPRMEFGKNLLDDYDDNEWNLTYNLLADCISLYFKFPEKINPPMERANQRNIRLKVGETFYQWALDKFIANTDSMALNPEILDNYIDKEEFYSEFEQEVNLTSRPNWDKQKYSKNSFKKHLQSFCDHHGIIMNPSDVDGYEKDRKRIRKSFGSKKVECFYFRASDSSKWITCNSSEITTSDNNHTDVDNNEFEEELPF